MHNPKAKIKWEKLSNWWTTNFIGRDGQRGLFRMRYRGEVVFIGYAAKTDLITRIYSYRNSGGAWKQHEAGKRIHEHGPDIEVDIAVLDLPAHEIKRIAEALIERKCPPWNNLAARKAISQANR